MLKLFKNLRKKDWALIALSVVFIFAQVFLDLKLPDYMAEVTRLVQTPGSTLNEILYQGLLMLLMVLGSVITSIVVGFIASNVGVSFSHKLRDDIYAKVESFTMEEINYFSTSSLITRTTNDVRQVQTVVTLGLQVMLKAPIMATWAVLKIYDKGFEWSLATLIAVLIMLVLIVVVMIVVMPKFKRMQILTDDINRAARENLMGLRVIRAYNAEDYQNEKFETVNEALTALLSTSFGFVLMFGIIKFSQKYFILKLENLGELNGHI